MTTVLFHYEDFERAYISAFKDCLPGNAKIKGHSKEISSLLELTIPAKKLGITKIATTSEKVLHLLGGSGKISTHAGSIHKYGGCEFLLLPPLEWLHTVTYGRFLMTHYMNKFYRPEKFLDVPPMAWENFDPARGDYYYSLAESALLMAVDIETEKENLAITESGFCIISPDYTSLSVVVPMDNEYNVEWKRQFLARTKCPKAFQNGKYDNAYYLRYGMPVTNYLLDTCNMLHAWYSELPKDLEMIATFCIRDWKNWKEETGPEYNAKDCHATAWSALWLILNMPDWAMKNYMMEFPVVFPCILAEATGIKLDLPEMDRLHKQVEVSFLDDLTEIREMLDCMFYNPSSPPQTTAVFNLLGSPDIKGSSKTQMDKFKSRHPLNARIGQAIQDFREGRKMYATYLDKKKAFKGRALYVINPHGTDTGRNASKESHFWCGWQIQNIPNDKEEVSLKSVFIADDGFYLGEADGEQAEARDTGYLSGDINLINAVEGVKDFHSVNASAFFGVPYEEITRTTFDAQGHYEHKTLNKKLRDLSKRTNHGANYNMGAKVLLETMGIKKVIEAKRLLGLPSRWTLLQVTQYLLERFDATYPVVRGDYYNKLVADIISTHMLVGPTGWTRYCFGDPRKSKPILNSYVAHPSQSLNAMVLNQAFVKVFNEVWMPNKKDFKMLAQIHDSILFQYRIGRKDLALKVKELMEIPVVVKDTYGIERTLIVPVAVKGEATRWSDLKKVA